MAITEHAARELRRRELTGELKALNDELAASRRRLAADFHPLDARGRLAHPANHPLPEAMREGSRINQLANGLAQNSADHHRHEPNYAAEERRGEYLRSRRQSVVAAVADQPNERRGAFAAGDDGLSKRQRETWLPLMEAAAGP